MFSHRLIKQKQKIKQNKTKQTYLKFKLAKNKVTVHFKQAL